MTRLPLAVLMRCFARTYLVSAAFNARGLQNIGFVYILDPGLRAIHTDPAALRLARGRYLRHYNCHPFWTPFLVGTFLNMESSLGGHMSSVPFFMNLKDVTANTLSAIGDSVFSGSFMVSWALLASICIALHEPHLVLVLTAVLFLGVQLFKLVTFFAGLRSGLAVLHLVRRWDLINWGEMLKVCNAFLVFLFLALTLQPERDPMLWLAISGVLPLAAWLTGRVHFPRIVLH